MSDERREHRDLIDENRHLRARIAQLEKAAWHAVSDAGVDPLASISLALAHAPCGAVVASTSASGAVQYTNAEFSAITGYTLEDIPTVGDWLLRAYPDDDYRAEVIANWERDVGEPSRNVVYRVRCADGGDKHLQLRAALLPDERMVVTMLDVTEQRRALARLSESEARLRQLADTLDVVFWIVQIEPERILFASPAFETIWGRSVEDLYADPRLWSAAIHPEDAPSVLAAWEACLEGRSPVLISLYRIIRPDGSIRWIEDNGRAVRDPQGTIYRMVGNTHDVTERIEVARALRESEERFRQLAETLPSGLVVHAGGRIVYGNRAAAEVAGCDATELIGRNVFSFVHPDSVEVTQARIATIYAKAGDAGWIESTFQRADGSPFPAEVASSRIDWRGEPAGLVVFNDVTLRKQAQDEQRRLEHRMLEAQRMESMAVLAGGVAHDFNNLLVGMLGNADLALLELPPHSPARGRIEGVELAARRAAELARQMLAYSGKGRFVVGELDLHTLLREISHLLEATLTRKAALEFRFADQLPHVRGDATQIRQVLMNLMTNAAEAIEDTSGIISLETGLVQIDGESDGELWPAAELEPGYYAVVAVADTGMGMDEATRRRIFDPFFTTKFTGRGLGLAAVMGIVKGHGGAIRVQSAPGRGSRFEVLLPAMMDGLVQDPEAPSDVLDERLSPSTVLIVDDDETVRSVSAAMLEHAGYRILTAEDGLAAVELFETRSEEIDLVLLDLSMPRMDGQACYEKLRAIRPGIRVVLSSGFNERDAIERFEGGELAGFIQKPFRAKTLIGTVAKALR